MSWWARGQSQTEAPFYLLISQCKFLIFPLGTLAREGFACLLSTELSVRSSHFHSALTCPARGFLLLGQLSATFGLMSYWPL